MKPVVLLNSGGPDCACVAAWLHGRGFRVVSLYIDLGAANRDKAMQAARETADRWCAEHYVVTLDLGGSPSYVRASGSWSQAPALASMLVSIGACWAGMRGITEVYSGLEQVSKEWMEAQRLFIDHGLNERVAERHFPVWGMSKEEIRIWANVSEVELVHTVSGAAP